MYTGLIVLPCPFFLFNTPIFTNLSTIFCVLPNPLFPLTYAEDCGEVGEYWGIEEEEGAG